MKPRNVCIVGMGYVGLTLAVTLAEAGFKVTGVEVNKAVVRHLRKGSPQFHEKGLPQLLRKQLANGLTVSTRMPRNQDAFVLCVSTPIDQASKQPILKYVVRAAREVKRCLQDHNLVVVRSTVPMGVTRKIVKPILDQAGKEYSLAFCPERTAEGNALKELRELPQIVGGLDEESVDRAIALFRPITKTIIDVSSIEAAEMIKLINNAYRDLNFAYANEVALASERFGLDPVEVIKAANLGYSRSNIPSPGLVGGACLEKDPHLFAHALAGRARLVRQARSLNECMPAYVIQKVCRHLAKLQGKKASKKVFVSGFAFKGNPETSDVRGSPAVELVKQLRKQGYKKIFGHDFVVGRQTLKSLGVRPCTLAEGFRGAACALIANNHPAYGLLDILPLTRKMEKGGLLMDCWHLFDAAEVRKAGCGYGGIGLG